MQLKRALIRFAELIRFALPTLLVAAVTRPDRSAAIASQPPRILVTRLDLIGDFIMTTPFLRELRRNFPHSPITLVVRGNPAPLAIACPYVDRVLVLDSFPGRKGFSNYLRYLRGFAGYVGYLRDFAKRHLVGEIDIAIQPRWDVDLEWASLITWLSGAARTIGYTETTSPEKALYNAGYNSLFTEILAPGPGQHEVHRNLDIVRYLGGAVENTALEVWWSLEDRLQADRFLTESGFLSASRLIAFGIGASKGWTRWPFYGELVGLLSENLAFTPLLLIGPGEEELAREISLISPKSVLMQHMPLRVVACVLSHCSLFVGNNSGPMHMASAVGIPVVEISPHPLDGKQGHQNDPERTGSLALKRSVVRPRSFLRNCEGGCIASAPHCIATIRPEEVAAPVLQLLGGDSVQLESSTRKATL